MIIGEIGAEVGRADRHGGDAVAHFDGCGAAIDHAESDGAIMATEAKF